MINQKSVDQILYNMSYDDSNYDIDWMAGAIDRHIHDPYALYESLCKEAPA